MSAQSGQVLPSIRIVVLTAFASLLSGCLVSNVQTERPFNALGRSAHLDLTHEGYVIAIEKRTRGKVNGPEKNYADRFQPLPGTSSHVHARNIRFQGVTNDPNVMLVTHIASFFGNREFLYNAYAKYGEEDTDYEAGYHALQSLQTDLVSRLTVAKENGDPYTHIFLLAMGWNSDQHRTIWRSNHILNRLKEVAERETDGGHFRPLTIIVTWPSVWKGVSDYWWERKALGHAGSYFNKAADADEIGYTLANWMIHKQLPEIWMACDGNNFPMVVALGHSFGARILSQALASKGHLKEEFSPDFDKPVDLFIGLQAAFSANRFIPGAGAEGSPFQDFPGWNCPIVLTSSHHDLATPIARFVSGASHVGGRFGLQKAREHDQIFEAMEWKGRDSLRLTPNKVTVVECDNIIQGIDAHNDITNQDVAELIWAITKLTRSQQ